MSPPSFTQLSNITTSSTILSACSRGSSNEVIALQTYSTTTALYRYSLTTGAQVGSAIVLPSHTYLLIAMLDVNTVICMSNANQYVSIADLIAETSIEVASMGYSYTTNTQNLAGGLNSDDSSLGFGLPSTAGKFIRFTSSTATLIDVTTLGNSNYRASCIINKGWGSQTTADYKRWIVGDVSGNICEIDYLTNPIRRYKLDAVRNLTPTTTIPNRSIVSLAYSNGYLLAGVGNGLVYLLNHNTGETLQIIGFCGYNTGSSIGPVISPDTYGLNGHSTIIATQNVAGYLHFWDFLQTPIFQMPVLGITRSAGDHLGVADGGTIWAVSGFTGILRLTVTGLRACTLKTESYTDDTNPVSGESLIIDDTGSDASMMFHTPVLASGQSLPITTASLSNIIRAASIGSGTDRKGACARTNS